MNDSRERSGIYRDQLITVEDLEILKRDLLEEMRKMLKVRDDLPGKKEWLRSSEVRQMLGISPGTLQTLRVNGTLSYTKIGGMIFYRQEDIANMLNGRAITQQ